MLTITVAVAAIAVLPAPAQAFHRLPHGKPFSHMTSSEKRDYLQRQIWHDKTALRWLKHAYRPRHLTRAFRSRAKTETRWFRASLRIAERNLARIPVPVVHINDWAEWSCIHNLEGATNANTGNGYYGGLQMDISFQTHYGPEFYARWGTANNWPIWAQVVAARRARDSGRGYYPWPNTARACGLL